MCGRYAYTLPRDAMTRLFETINDLESPPRYNIAPTQPVIAIWTEAPGRTARLARWGLVPGWVKDPRDFPLLVNARGETALDKPAFRTGMRHHRCVVPASGYYEWRTGPEGRKYPYYVSRADGGPIAFAGLYSTWMGPEGEEVDTVAIMTVPANADLSPIHDRMPAILESGEMGPWLDVRGVDAKTAHGLVRPLPPGSTVHHPVSTRVNASRFDDEELIAPVPHAQESVAESKPKPDGRSASVKKKTSSQLDLF